MINEIKLGLEDSGECSWDEIVELEEPRKISINFVIAHHS